MTVTNTSLLGLALPTTGTESGVWGDDVNNGLTILVDMSVAGTNNITQDSDITLAVSNGNNSSSFTSTATNSTVAQYYVLNCSGARTALRNIIVPTTSKTYVVTNGTTGGYSITVKKSGGTGVSVAAGETAIVFYNTVTGDVAKVSSTVNVSSFSAGTTGFTPSTATTGAVTLAGTLATTNGGTGLTSFTANGVAYATSTSALATGSALTFDGTNLSLGTVSGKLNFATTGSATQDYIGVGSDGYSLELATLRGANQPVLYQLNFGGNHIWSIASSEQMRLNSTGLGIGTNSPSYKLHINGSGAQAVQVTSTSASASLILQNFTGAGNYAYIQYNGYSGSGLQFYDTANVAARMTLDSSGNLGLGVTPSAWSSSFGVIQGYSGWSISGDGSNSNSVDFLSNAYRSGSNTYTYLANSTATRYQQKAGAHVWYNAPSTTGTVTWNQAMTLDNSSRLLVGTTSAVFTNSKIQVSSSSGPAFGAQVTATNEYAGGFWNSATSTTNLIAFYSGSSGTQVGKIQGDSGALSLYGPALTGGITIDSGNFVGVNTVSPSEMFEVYTNGGGNTYSKIRMTGSNRGGQLDMYNQGYPVARFESDQSGNITISSSKGFAQSSLSAVLSITTSGNVGIGTNNPTDKLHVYNTANTDCMLIESTQTYSTLAFKSSTNSNTAVFGINGVGDAYIENKKSSGNISFITNGSQAMTLDASGRLLVGVTSSQFSSGGAYFQLVQANNNWIHYLGNSQATGNIYGSYTYFTNQAPNNSTSIFYYAADSSAVRTIIYSNGGIGNYATNNIVFSDSTLKKNITLAKNYLSILNQIPVVTYLLNDQTDTDLNLGVIAQDVQKVAPELVTTINAGTVENPNIKLGVYDSDLKYAMLKAIQELSAKVTALEAKLGV
jgi:hypothetical protein